MMVVQDKGDDVPRPLKIGLWQKEFKDVSASRWWEVQCECQSGESHSWKRLKGVLEVRTCRGTGTDFIALTFYFRI
jgi:hypothetical protein